jgi:TolB-like protein/Flp pilus assembly protein TadD
MFRNKEDVPTDAGPTRLAIIPFVNIDNQPDQDFLADGMTEELISSLSKVKGLRVIAQTSVAGYQQDAIDVTHVGRELDVKSLIMGSVSRRDDKLHVAIKLVDVNTRELIWSGAYEREVKNAFNLQSEIAYKVTEELKIRLLGSELRRIQKQHTTDAEAVEEYLLGKKGLREKTSASIQESIIHFERAIAADSAFLLPYAPLAYAYALMAVAGYGDLPLSAVEERAKWLLNRALNVDPDFAEAHATLGYILFRVDWNWKGAETSLKRALELEPSNAVAHEWYALFLSIHRRYDEALHEMSTALNLNPLSPGVISGVARIHHFRGEFAAAIEYFNKALSINPNYAQAHFTMAMTYQRMENYQLAEREFLIARDLYNSRPTILGMLGAMYVPWGQEDMVKEIIRQIDEMSASDNRLYAQLLIQAAESRCDEVIPGLEYLFKQRYGLLIFLYAEENFQNCADRAGYQQILQAMDFGR